MATINDLNIPDFSKLTDDELLDLIKSARSRRRSPDPVVKEVCKKKAISKQKRGKAIALQDVGNMLEGLTPEQVKNLREQLLGKA